MHPLVPRAASTGIALLLLLAGSAAAQAPDARVRPASPAELRAFQVRRATVQHLSFPRANPRELTFEVMLGGAERTVFLREHDVRSKDFKLLAADASGTRVLPTPPNTTWRGVVQGRPESIVAASLHDGRLSAVLRLADQDSLWGIQPVAPGGAAAHIVYRAADGVGQHGVCGVATSGLAKAGNPPQSFGNGMVSVCEIAVDADYPLYVANSANTTLTQNTVTAVINGVAAIYKRDVNIDYQITTIVVRTTNVYSTTSTALLPEFGNRWNSLHTNIQRDTAHLMSGATSGGGGVLGIAYLGTICNLSSSYGVSWIGFSSNLTNRVGLVSHELGHAWNAQHCSGSGCYIMCAGFGGCGQDITRFGTASQSAIVAFRNTCTCLTSSGGPVLTQIKPNSVQAFQGGTLTLTGSKFTNATQVSVGAQNLLPNTGFTIVNDGTITFDSPIPYDLSPVAVKVWDTNGASAPVTLGYTATTPPKLTASDAPRNFAAVWIFGAEPGHLWFLILSPTSTTVPALGFQWLNPFVLLQSGALGAAGVGSYATLVPASAPIGVKVYSQVVTLDAGKGSFAGNTNVTTSTVK